MFIFIIGTSAELIKVRPLMKRFEQNQVAFEVWSTYQHTELLDKVMTELAVPTPTVVFARGFRGRPLEAAWHMFPWFWTVLSSSIRKRAELKHRIGKSGVVFVHGDTVTTVLGALIGRSLRRPVAHIEAGLRSGNLFKPFPEELDRRIVGKLANIHFAPTPEACKKLRAKDVVCTHGNTAVDGALDALGETRPFNEKPYGLILLHRFELMNRKDFLKESLRTIDESARVPMFILTDVYSSGPVIEALRAAESRNIQSVPKLSYVDFINAMANAEVVVTDSGGAQQELGLLGVPTILHREVTESPDGVGHNVALTNWDLDKLKALLENSSSLRRDVARPEKSPSDIIFEALASRGFLDANKVS